MKKTLVIIIIAVYVSSIVVVNLFGLKDQVFDGVTYVDFIKCETVTVQNENPVTLTPKQIISGVPLFMFDFIPAPDGSSYTTDAESIITNPNAVQINYEVLPHDANNTKVKFIFDEDAMDGVVVFNELSRTFIFLKPNRKVNIKIESSDGSKISTTISIMGRIPK